MVIWSYLLKEFFKFFLLSVFVFVALLFIMKGQEVARFATLQSDFKLVFLFFLYQIPFILPLAIPISGLISSYLLMQKMTTSFELTSLRSSGLNPYSLLFPLYITGITLCFINFFIASELSPKSRLATLQLPYEAAQNNPLVLLKKSKFVDFKDSYIDINLSEQKSEGKDVIIITKDNHRLHLLTAENFFFKNDALIAKNIGMISPINPSQSPTFDDFIVENIQQSTVNPHYLSQFFQKPLNLKQFEYLSTKECLIKNQQKSNKNSKHHFQSELFRRLFFFLSPLSFLLIGLSFGISIGRDFSQKRLFGVFIFSLVIFIGFIGGKSMKTSPFLSLALYLLPQIFSIYGSLRRQHKIFQGASNG